MSFEGGFKIDVDLMRGLPEQKSAWPIWLGDHYTRGNLTVTDVVRLLLERLIDEMHTSKDPVATYLPFKEAWDTFVQGAEFGDPMLFENMVFRAAPELGQAVTATRVQNEQ